jgi:hypothetical protein
MCSFRCSRQCSTYARSGAVSKSLSRKHIHVKFVVFEEEPGSRRHCIDPRIFRKERNTVISQYTFRFGELTKGVCVEEEEEDAGREVYIPVSRKTDGTIVRAEDIEFEQRPSLRLYTAFIQLSSSLASQQSFMKSISVNFGNKQTSRGQPSILVLQMQKTG